MLLNPGEQFKKPKLTDWEKDIFDAAPEVDVDTSSQDNKDFNLWDAWNKPADSPFISNSAGPMMFLGEKFGDGAAQLVSDGGEAFNQVTDTIGDVSAPVVSVSGDAFNQVTDTIGDATSDTLTDIQKRTQLMLDFIFWDPVDTIDGFANLVPTTGQEAGEAFNQAAETAKKTVNNFLPVDIGKNLGLALYGILAVAGIIVFLYILSLLKPLFEIGSNVSEK